MMHLSFRRRVWRRWLRILFYAVCAVIVLDLWITLHGHKTFVHNLAAHTVTHVEDLPSRARSQKIFIVAQFWTSADTLVGFWNDALIKLIETLGPQNVYVSIIASAGLDNTNEIVRYLDQELLEPLKVPRTIIIDPTTHQDEIDKGPVDEHGQDRDGWIYTEDAKAKELRRVPYLSKFRNRGMEPLRRMYAEHGTKYDKILYLNDVEFQTSDVLSLLATNDGVYDVACSFDFHLTPGFYDTFALRDIERNPPVSPFYPFFRSSKSRNQILRGLPAPVTSCWNGMVVADATPYYNRSRPIDSKSSKNGPNTMLEVEGLKYRAITDTLAQKHLEGSECCLIHADLIARDQAKKGLFINPSVRVGYKRDKNKYKTSAYEDVHQGPGGLSWVSLNEYVYGKLRNRVRRWIFPAWYEMWTINRRVAQWKKEGKKLGEVREEVGDYCIIDEMHVLIWNGWRHVGHRNR